MTDDNYNITALEIWKDIPDFPHYQVSNLGRVKSFRKRKSIIMSPVLNNVVGYLYVGIKNNIGKVKMKPVHRLVLDSFVSRCPKGFEACHNDDNKINNRLENLRWGTRSDNIHDSYRNGKRSLGEKHPASKLSDEIIITIREMYRSGFRQCDISEVTGIHFTQIHYIVKRKTWKHL